jgi:hypothetical protein
MNTPECCKKCKRYKNSCLNNYKQCPAWRAWFSKTWNGIREAAQSVKKKEAGG